MCHLYTYSNDIKILIVLSIYQWYWFLQHLLVDTSAWRNILSAQSLFVSTFKASSWKKKGLIDSIDVLHKLPEVEGMLNQK